MTFQERLTEYISACFTGIWIESREADDAIAEIGAVARQESWRLAVWDINRGFCVPGAGGGDGTPPGGTDPLAAIRALPASVPWATGSSS